MTSLFAAPNNSHHLTVPNSNGGLTSQPSNSTLNSRMSMRSSGSFSSTVSSKFTISVRLPGANTSLSTPSENAADAASKAASNSQEIELVVDLKTKFTSILSQVAVIIGLVDVDLFGLALSSPPPDDEPQFVDLDSKIQDVVPDKVIKEVRSRRKSNAQSQPLLTIQLRVFCYVDNPAAIRDRVALHLYYNQLRENALEYGQLITAEACYTLAALALQADFAKASKLTKKSATLSKTQVPSYVPQWLIRLQGADYICAHLPQLQSELLDMSRVEAQLMYCRYASQRPFHHNLHLYGIKRRKADPYYTLFIGIGYRGVDIFEDVEGYFKKIMGSFDWANISKIQSSGKCLEMKAVGSLTKFTYFADTSKRAQYLLKLTRRTHQFQLSLSRSADAKILAVVPAFRSDFPTLKVDKRHPTGATTNGGVTTLSKTNPPSSEFIELQEFPSRRNNDDDLASDGIEEDSGNVAIATSVVMMTPEPPVVHSLRTTAPGTPGWAPSVLLSGQVPRQVASVRPPSRQARSSPYNGVSGTNDSVTSPSNHSSPAFSTANFQPNSTVTTIVVANVEVVGNQLYRNTSIGSSTEEMAGIAATAAASETIATVDRDDDIAIGAKGTTFGDSGSGADIGDVQVWCNRALALHNDKSNDFELSITAAENSWILSTQAAPSKLNITAPTKYVTTLSVDMVNHFDQDDDDDDDDNNQLPVSSSQSSSAAAAAAAPGRVVRTFSGDDGGALRIHLDHNNNNSNSNKTNHASASTAAHASNTTTTATTATNNNSDHTRPYGANSAFTPVRL